MTVAELIEKLKTMPQHLPVGVNDEAGGRWHPMIDTVFEIEDETEDGDEAAVVIAVNSL
jgi:hypothetical protein